MSEAMRAGKCRSCGADILWVRTADGLLWPVDEEPKADGNVVVKDGVAHTLFGDLFEDRVEGARYQCHFDTCRTPKKYRKNRK